MENKEKRKRKVSILTVFIWLALIVTMSVVVISGINRSNALEEGETKKITIKLDLSEYFENEGITQQEEIETYLEGYLQNIAISNSSDKVYVGSEKNTIGIYEINITNNSESITIQDSVYYDFINNDELLEVKYKNGKATYSKNLLEGIDEYNFVVKKKETRIVKVKIDFNEIIKDRGITDETEIEKILSEYYSRLTGRNEKDYDAFAFVNLNSKYIGSEQGTIGVYEVEIPKNMEYIQVVRPYDANYIELCVRWTDYDMIRNDKVLEMVCSKINGYYNPSSGGPACYILKVSDNIEEYNISIEKKEEITINVDENITKVDVLNQTNKIIERRTSKVKDGKFNLKLSKGAEYDIIFAPNYTATYEYRCVYEDGNKLDKKMIYTPSYNEEEKNYYKTIKQGENKSEYNFETTGRFESNIKWKDDKHAKLYLKVRENWTFYGKYDPLGFGGSSYCRIYWLDNNEKKSDFDNRYIIFIEKLDEDFSVAKEYENDKKWLIVNEDEIKDTKFEVPEYAKKYFKLDLQNNEYIPEYVYANFFEHNFDTSDSLDWNSTSNNTLYVKSNEKIYNIYIKDKNMLYCLVPADEADSELYIDLEYKGNYNEKNKTFNFNSKSIFFYNQSNACEFLYQQSYVGSTLIGKNLKYNQDKKTRIVVKKSVDNVNDNETYYIGLFENEKDEMTDEIYELVMKNGVGSTKIEFDGYDETKKYYIYEVDENGNKIANENIKYSKNKVLENINKKEEYNILSENIVSSVYSKLANEGYFTMGYKDGKPTTSPLIKLSDDIGTGMGEEYYTDNNLLKLDVYEDVVTISERDKAYLVKYESEKGGKLEGDTEEVVREGNKPVNVPDILPNEGYEFEKWVVIKNGEEIEVIPSEYVILEDTIFIAKYRKIEIVTPSDTSDINIWLYVGIAVISVICVIIVVISLNLNKKRKTT